MSDSQWYKRLASVPGVCFTGHPEIDRRKLPGHNARPTENRFEYDGKIHRSFSWKIGNGSTSQSPASAWASSPIDSFEGPKVIRRMYEALELPGTVADYHFAMLGAYELLWKLRKSEPEVLPELERIFLLDIALVEAQGDSFSLDDQEERTMPYVPAFHHLVSLYEREGFLIEALGIAKRATKAGQGSSDEERLSQQVAQLKHREAL